MSVSLARMACGDGHHCSRPKYEYAPYDMLSAGSVSRGARQKIELIYGRRVSQGTQKSKLCGWREQEEEEGFGRPEHIYVFFASSCFSQASPRASSYHAQVYVLRLSAAKLRAVRNCLMALLSNKWREGLHLPPDHRPSTCPTVAILQQ